MFYYFGILDRHGNNIDDRNFRFRYLWTVAVAVMKPKPKTVYFIGLAVILAFIGLPMIVLLNIIPPDNQECYVELDEGIFVPCQKDIMTDLTYNLDRFTPLFLVGITWNLIFYFYRKAKK